MSGSLTVVLPGISLCSSPALEQWPPLLPQPSETLSAQLKGIHSLLAALTAPACPAPPSAPSTSLPRSSAPAREGSWSRAGAAADDALTEQSGDICSPGLHHSQTLHALEHQKDVSSKIPVVDGDMRRALCSQPLAQEHHGGSRKAQGAVGGGGRGVDLGCWLQPLVFLVARSTAPTCGDPPADLRL